MPRSQPMKLPAAGSNRQYRTAVNRFLNDIIGQIARRTHRHSRLPGAQALPYHVRQASVAREHGVAEQTFANRAVAVWHPLSHARQRPLPLSHVRRLANPSRGKAVSRGALSLSNHVMLTC
jgi:hypothetical protein